MKSSTLKRLYKRYNRRYFEGLLPVDGVVVRFADIGSDVYGLCAPWGYEIEINSKDLSVDEIKGTLLHECIHMWQYFMEDKELECEKEHHDIDFYFRALTLYQLTGYPVA